MSTRNRLEPMLDPCSFFSRRNSGPWISTIVPTGIMPMTVAVPPGADDLEGLLGRRLEADRLERVVDAAVGHVAHGLDDIDLACVDGVR